MPCPSSRRRWRPVLTEHGRLVSARRPLSAWALTVVMPVEARKETPDASGSMAINPFKLNTRSHTLRHAHRCVGGCAVVRDVTRRITFRNGRPPWRRLGRRAGADSPHGCRLVGVVGAALRSRLVHRSEGHGAPQTIDPSAGALIVGVGAGRREPTAGARERCWGG